MHRTAMKSFVLRIINMLFGLFLYALGIVLALNANIGYAPWEVFHVGLAVQTGLSIGVASIVAGIAIVIIVTLCREKLGFGTLASMILTGVFIDMIMAMNIIPIMTNLVSGVIMLVTGLFIISAGSCFYIKSAFGAGPRDNLMVVLTRYTKLSIGICRSMVELAVTVVGWKLGGMVGIGTVISVFAIGLCVHIIFTAFNFDATAVQHETLQETINNLHKHH